MESITNQKESLFHALKVAFSFGILILAIHLLVLFFNVDRTLYSIYPRDIHQWYGIITGQFIHSNWSHLFSNLAPLFITVFMIFFFYHSIGWAVLSMILVLTGFAVFVFARESSHLGASGLVYGLIAFVFFSGIFRRNPKSIILMIIVVILYGGYTAGLLPIDEKVSWESHLFGALTGFWTAFIFRNFKESDEQVIEPSWANEKGIKTSFFAKDTFEKTIAQRKKEQEEKQIRQSIWPDNFDSTL
ncbi:MAG: rhomboid family intramembrane serine protease [Saprospiraceae bacterium]|nr:rhomboid family intramembrane serine protease [Saprospiraceae bacterium]